eukprot:m.268260 g.268260  ORF g.268260 m.268260 type:complete len:753 (-) comp77793_c0_seq1:190-2448(-)
MWDGFVLGLALVAFADQSASSFEDTCNISLIQTLRGECLTSDFGCDRVTPYKRTMYVSHGCCAKFNCDGFTTHCCSTDHFDTVGCRCGPRIPAPPGGTFHVAANAPPNGNGSVEAPFATIQACVDIAVAATSRSFCHVGAGIYRESVQAIGGVDILGSGTESNGGTVLDGTVVLEDASTHWSLHKGNIYKTKLPRALYGIEIQQLFVDGAYVSEARWPNANLSDMLNVSTWATMKQGSGWGWVHDPEMAEAAMNFSGARATLNLGTGVFTWTRTVDDFSGSSFNYTADLDGLKRPNGTYVFTGCKYFLAGVLDALDAPGEWWVDNVTKMVYVWTPDGKSPRGGRVSIKVKDFCFDAMQEQTMWSVGISNVKFFGCTLRLANCSGCMVEDVNLEYPSFNPNTFRTIPEGDMPVVTTLIGNESMFRRVRLAHTNNGGIMVAGSRNIFTQMLIEDTNWIGSLDFPAIKIGFSIHHPSRTTTSLGGPRSKNADESQLRIPLGERNVIEYTTVRGFGNSGIVTSQLQNTIRYTHVVNGGLIGGDNAGIHADNAPVNCTLRNCSKTWHHLWVHNCREKCVRCDDGSESCEVHHAVIFNCGEPLHNGNPSGLLLKGWGHHVWANTIFNTSSNGQGDLTPITEFTQNSNSQFFNLAATTINTRGGPPITTPGAVNFTGGLVVGLNVSELLLRDAASFDFVPTLSSPLVNVGVKHLPYVSSQHVDAGAYQMNDPLPHWQPGCNFSHRCAPDYISGSHVRSI